jgi:hypothetical protein
MVGRSGNDGIRRSLEIARARNPSLTCGSSDMVGAMTTDASRLKAATTAAPCKTVQFTRADNVADFGSAIDGRIRAIANVNALFVEARGR